MTPTTRLPSSSSKATSNADNVPRRRIEMAVLGLMLSMAVPARAATFTVDNSGACNDVTGVPAYCTLQPAIDAAAAAADGADIVNVNPGTYDLTGSPSLFSGIDIGAPLTLQATNFVNNGNNTTTILRGVDPMPSAIDLRITSPDVTIQGFTFDFNGPPTGAGGSRNFGGIEINGNPNNENLHLLNNRFHLPDGDPNFNFGDYAFRTGGVNSAAGLQINNNTFLADGDHGGFALFLNPETTSNGGKQVNDNTFSGALIQGITVDTMSDVTIDGNTVDSTLTCDPTYFHPVMIAAGPFADGAQSNITITNNKVGTGGASMGGCRGINVGYTGTVTAATVTDNVVEGASWAGFRNRAGAVTTYENNNSQDNVNGFMLSGGTPTITANSIIDNTTGVLVNGTSTAALHYNRIFNNSANGLDQTAGTVDAENNWWGCSDGPNDPNGLCDTVVSTGGTVDFNPWLVLTLTLSPNTINQCETSGLTGTLNINSDNVDQSPNHIPNATSPATAPPRIPGTMITFSAVAPFATVSGPNPRPLVDGSATTTARPSCVPGDSNITATVDNQTHTGTLHVDGSAAWIINRVSLHANRATSTKARGTVRVQAVIDDNDTTAYDLEESLLAGGVSMRIRDAQDFDVEMHLDQCTERGRSIRCIGSDGSQASFRLWHAAVPRVYRMRARMMRLPSADTGTIAPTDPVVGILTQDEVCRYDCISDDNVPPPHTRCTQTKTGLRCQESD
jgi:hypothetical protein